ncbi:MAG: hypothetical protein ACUVTM_04720 [Candidatus Bathyarchaeia archaeon]
MELNLSFWIYLFKPTTTNENTVAAITISVITPKTAKGISYHVTSAKSQGMNVTAIMIPDIKSNIWNNVRRSFDKDFKNAYPNFELKDVKELKITLWSINTSNPIPV